MAEHKHGLGCPCFFYRLLVLRQGQIGKHAYYYYHYQQLYQRKTILPHNAFPPSLDKLSLKPLFVKYYLYIGKNKSATHTMDVVTMPTIKPTPSHLKNVILIFFSFSSMPSATILAVEPTSVMLPPKQPPNKSAHHKG